MRRNHSELKSSFEIWLVKTREDLVGEKWLTLGIEVLLVIFRIDEAVDTKTVISVVVLKLNDCFIESAIIFE